MTLTTDQITERKEQLRQEILERECLLAALEVLHKHATGNRTTKPIDVGAFLPALLGQADATAAARQITVLDSAPPPLPPPPPPERYQHPELKKLGHWHGLIPGSSSGRSTN